MGSKTPNFDKELNKVLIELKPHKRTCSQCGRKFEILNEDIEFYKMLKVPPPKLCPSCRMQRRMVFVKRLPKFYRRDCEAKGHKESLISTYPKESPIHIYDFKYYFSDNWDATDYGMNFDLHKSFFKQFYSLVLKVPHADIPDKDPNAVNSTYILSGYYPKNCYFSVGPYQSEDIYYSYCTTYSKDCFDATRIDHCELGYWLIDCKHCYKSFFLQKCRNCIECFFLYDCANCQNCFCCTNLRNKKYYFFNRPLSKEEYQRKIKQIYLGNSESLMKIKEEFQKIIQQEGIHRAIMNRKVENCIGDDLNNCKDCYIAFGGINSENIRYGQIFIDLKDSMDVTNTVKGSNCYETAFAGDIYDVKFSNIIRGGLSVEYSRECYNCEYIFGCVGLRYKKYHIFNKAYTPQEYWKLVDKIKTKMLKDGEYGEFFPISASLYPYNDTFAYINFPLSRKEVEKIGGWWYEQSKFPDVKDLSILKASDVPQDIKEVDDSILNRAIICEKTGKPFRIIKKELDFYRRYQLPLPIVHPVQRILDRFQNVNPYKLWKAICQKCHKEIYTSYPPEKQKELKIYCEKCYLEEVG